MQIATYALQQVWYEKLTAMTALKLLDFLLPASIAGRLKQRRKAFANAFQGFERLNGRAGWRFLLLSSVRVRQCARINRRLAEISWMGTWRNSKPLISKATIQKVSTTFLTLSPCLFQERELGCGKCAAAVEAADPIPISPTPADVPLLVG